MAVILFKKMLRDIRTSLSAYILCILIVAIGLCGYSVLGLCYDNMVLSRDTFFRNTDYCDGFADTADTDLQAASWTECPLQKGVSCRMWNWRMWMARLSCTLSRGRRAR